MQRDVFLRLGCVLGEIEIGNARKQNKRRFDV